MQSLVDNDVTFAGPLVELEGVADYTEGIRGKSQVESDIVVRKVSVEGPDVLTRFDLHTTVASHLAAANWLHVELGKITSLLVAFDARELAPYSEWRTPAWTAVREHENRSFGQSVHNPLRGTCCGSGRRVDTALLPATASGVHLASLLPSVRRELW